MKKIIDTLAQKFEEGPFSHSRIGALDDGVVVIRCQSWVPLAARVVTKRSQAVLDAATLENDGTCTEWYAELGGSPVPTGDPEPSVWADGIHRPRVYVSDSEI